MGSSFTQERFINTYYPSFESFNTEFHRRIKANDVPVSVYRVPKIAFYMLWFGVNRNHLSEIRKHHLGSDNIFDPVLGRTFYVPIDVMAQIKDAADFSLGNPELVVSDYALRTRVSGKMTASSIASVISYFNGATGGGTHNGFQMQPIFESGLFSRIYQMQLQGYQFPVYRQNKRLSEEGHMEFEHLFQRKFSSIKALTTYVNKYRFYIDCFYNGQNPP